jgi:hypothetical protein
MSLLASMIGGVLMSEQKDSIAGQMSQPGLRGYTAVFRRRHSGRFGKGLGGESLFVFCLRRRIHVAGDKHLADRSICGSHFRDHPIR